MVYKFHENSDLENLEIQARDFLDICSRIKQKLEAQENESSE